MRKFAKNYVPYMTLFMSTGALFFSFYIYTSFIDEDGNVLDGAMLYAVIAFLVAMFFIYIYNLLFYNCSGYELTDEYVSLEKGVIFKRNKIVRYDKINAVDVKQNIIGRLFNVSSNTIRHWCDKYSIPRYSKYYREATL